MKKPSLYLPLLSFFPTLIFHTATVRPKFHATNNAEFIENNSTTDEHSQALETFTCNNVKALFKVRPSQKCAMQQSTIFGILVYIYERASTFCIWGEFCKKLTVYEQKETFFKIFLSATIATPP